MTVHFYTPNMLIWLWLVPVAVGLFIHAAAKRRKAATAFGSRIRLLSRKREAFGASAALLLTILALARPAWDLQELPLEETGRDVVFLLDVSRSMLAEDLHPNRLENAKTAILDCVASLSGDRVGLVLFAGSAEIRCPLTADYDYFRMALRQASPVSIAAGGTMLAHAVERTLDKLIDPEKSGMQDLILITDGEDQIEGADELEAARKLKESGVRLIAIGLGDRRKGSRIRITDPQSKTGSFMKHGNTEVWSKLRTETLREMVDAAENGAYFEVGSGAFPLKQIYRQVMEHAERTATESQVIERYEEKFHHFLAAAVAILLLTTRWRQRTNQHGQTGTMFNHKVHKEHEVNSNSPHLRGLRAFVVKKVLGRLSGIPLLFLLFTAPDASGKASDLFKEGNREYAKERFVAAAKAYQSALEEADDPEIHYNLGNALYRNGDYLSAAEAYETALLGMPPESLRAHCWYNMGNCMVKLADTLRSDDPAAAQAPCRQALAYYEAVLTEQPDYADAAHNLDVAQQLLARLEVEQQQAEEQKQQQDQLLQYLRQKLMEFIERQQNLIAANETGAPQKALELDTRKLAGQIAETGLHTAKMLPDGTSMPGPLEATHRHTQKAAEAMQRPDQTRALNELQAALAALPQDPDAAEGDQEEWSDDEDYDMEYDESESDQYDQSDPFGDFSEYEEIRGVPPPNQTEMEILAEEMQNQQRRQQKKAGEYKTVEKDW